jgi:hypothetical protein
MWGGTYMRPAQGGDGGEIDHGEEGTQADERVLGVGRADKPDGRQDQKGGYREDEQVL